MCLLLLWFQLFFTHFYCSKYGVRNANENLGTYIRLARTLKGRKWIFKNICGLNWIVKWGEKKENAKFYCIRRYTKNCVSKRLHGYVFVFSTFSTLLCTYVYVCTYILRVEAKWNRKFSNFCQDALNWYTLAIRFWKCVGMAIISQK